MLIYVDTTAQSLVISPNDVRRCLPPKITAGDTVPITLAFLQRNPQPLNTGQPVYTYLDFSAAGVILSVGPFGLAPTGGTFTLTWLTSTTPALPFNINCYDLSVALNALTDVTANGGVIVTGDVGGPFVVTFLLPAVRDAITAVSGLFPASTVTIGTSQSGTTLIPATQTITLSQVAPVQVSSWTPQSAAAITITQLQGNVIQRIAIPAGTYGGSFTLTLNGNTTAAIPFAAQIDVVAAAIAALPGGTGVTVWPGNNFWDITIPLNTFAFTGSATGLIIPLTLTGSLILTAQSVQDLLAGQTSILIPFLIQTSAGTIQTFYDYLIQLNAS